MLFWLIIRSPVSDNSPRGNRPDSNYPHIRTSISLALLHALVQRADAMGWSTPWQKPGGGGNGKSFGKSNKGGGSNNGGKGGSGSGYTHSQDAYLHAALNNAADQNQAFLLREQKRAAREE